MAVTVFDPNNKLIRFTQEINREFAACATVPEHGFEAKKEKLHV